MTIRLFSLTGLAILLSSCATTTANYYPQTVSSWQNAPVSQLVRQWGLPNEKVVLSDGRSLYLYKTETYRANTTRSSIVVRYEGGEPRLVTSPTPNFGPSRGGPVVTCVTMFIADPAGRIVRTELKGNCFGGANFAKSRENRPQL